MRSTRPPRADGVQHTATGLAARLATAEGETSRPGTDFCVVNTRASLDFCERGQRFAVTLLIEGEVPLNRFVDDPTPRTLKPPGEAIQFAGETRDALAGETFTR